MDVLNLKCQLIINKNMKKFTVEQARNNFGVKEKIEAVMSESTNKILKDIKRISTHSNHALVTGSALDEIQIKNLTELRYTVEKCNWYERIFKGNFNKISW